MKNKLEIVLITFNRSFFLKKTLEQLYSKGSPIKNYKVTILDNNSNDDTRKIVKKFQKENSNLNYRRNEINVGGNANICKAFEMLANSDADYGWVLCDDDVYDWSNWEEVERLMSQQVDCIGVANYVNNHHVMSSVGQSIFQLSFVPAGIYRLENLDSSVITNMYDAIFTMFPQLCVGIHLINNHKNIVFLENWIIDNGISYYKDKYKDKVDYSFTRHSQEFTEYAPRKNSLWILGFSNIITMVKDKNIQKDAVEKAVPYKDIYMNWDNFVNCMKNEYMHEDRINYMMEISRVTPPHVNKLFINDYIALFKQILSGLKVDIDNNSNQKIAKNEYIVRYPKFNKFEKIFCIKHTKDKRFKVIRVLKFIFLMRKLD